MRITATFPARVVVLAALSLGTACSQKPATIDFNGIPPGTLETIDTIPLPAVVVKDEKGEPLETQPPIEWSTRPDGIVQVIGTTLTPIKSGSVKLVAKVKETDVTREHPLKVQLVDRVSLKCEPETCRYAPGDRFRLRAEVRSGEELLEGLALDWTTEQREVLDAISGGEFIAKAPGVAKIKVSVRGVVATQTIFVESAVDQLVVLCPTPPQAYVAPSADELRTSCVVEIGDNLDLIVEARGDGEVMDRGASFTSTNPSYVGVSGGRVTGVQEGAAIVEVRVDNLVVSLPVEARRRVADRCTGNFQERFQKSIAGEDRLYACADGEAARCFEEKLTAKSSFSAAAAVTAARGCCCIAIPKLEGKPAAVANDAGPQ